MFASMFRRCRKLKYSIQPTIYSIARDSNSCIIYIADSQNYRIMSYAFNASTGNVFAGGQGAGTNGTQLNCPFGVYFDSLSNSLIIANSYANNSVRWNWPQVVGHSLLVILMDCMVIHQHYCFIPSMYYKILWEIFICSWYGE
jgi:hypothetical protein